MEKWVSLCQHKKHSYTNVLIQSVKAKIDWQFSIEKMQMQTEVDALCIIDRYSLIVQSLCSEILQ